MSVCPACKSEGAQIGVPCAVCGHVPSAALRSGQPVPSLDLETGPRSPSRPSKRPEARTTEKKELTIELAEDPRAPTSVPPHSSVSGIRSMPIVNARPTGPVLSEDEIEARVLAHYGEPSESIFLAPLYSYRVFARKAELRRAIVGRREDADAAKKAAEDALVALGERARSVAQTEPAFSSSLAEISAAEQLLLSRDQTLAMEQAAHKERLKAVDARIAKVEAERAQSAQQERALAERVAELQSAVARAQAKIKRAEIELRNSKEPS